MDVEVGSTQDPSIPESVTGQKESGALSATDVLRIIGAGRTLPAVFLVVGSKKFAVWQYSVHRRHVNYEVNSVGRGPYPSYSTLQQRVIPVIRNHVYVPSTTVTMDVNVKRAGAPRALLGTNGTLVHPTRDVRIVSISTWGKRDMSFTSSGALHMGVNHSFGSKLFDSIEDAAVVTKRTKLISCAIPFTTERVGGLDIPTWQLHAGCTVDIWIRSRDNLGLLREYASTLLDGQSLVVLRNAHCGHTWVVKEATQMFALADVVTDIELQRSCSASNPEASSQLKFYLVHKMRRREGVSTVHLAIVQERGASKTTTRVRCMQLSTGRGPGYECDTHANAGSVRRSIGFLQDGRKYFVYRVLLFADDFDPYVGRNGSAGGCYMLPVGIPLSQRTGVKGIRVLSMTPPGVSSGQVLMSLIPDIIESTVSGYRAVDADGNEYQLFIDIVGYECDYFAVQEESDLRGHNSLGPCNLCTFEKGNREGRNRSNFAYSTSIHSANPAFRRDRVRMEAMRSACTTDGELQSVGLRTLSSSDRANLPLHALSEALRQVRDNVPRTMDGEPVVPASFDPYLSIAIAPDHLFSNLIRDVITANLKSLSPKQRACSHALIRDALYTNGMQTESQYIDEKAGTLHMMSMTALYKVILVAPWAFALSRSMNETGDITFDASSSENIVILSFLLKELIADTVFYARIDRDGSALEKQFTTSGWRGRERNLKLKGMRYIRALDRCCGDSELQAKELDKPNVHRLLELYMHTIPMFGHVRLYQELALERAHQPIKRALNHSNFKNAQLQAMDHILADEWKGRIRTAIAGAANPEDLSEASLANLHRTLTRDKIVRNSDMMPSGTLRRIFDRMVLADINEFSAASTEPATQSSAYWAGSGEHVFHGRGSRWADVNECGKRALLAYVKKEHPSIAFEIHHLFRARRLTKVNGFQRAPTRDAFADNIRRRDVLQAVVPTSANNISEHNDRVSIKLLLPDDNVMVFSNAADSRPTYWFTTDIMELQPPATIAGRRCEAVAVVLPLTGRELIDRAIERCSSDEPGFSLLSSTTAFYLHSTKPSTGYLLPLYPAVMKPMKLHICRGACKFDHASGKLQHKVLEDRGEACIVYGSVDGFPPRCG